MTSLLNTAFAILNPSQAATTFAYWMIQSLAYGTVAAILTWLLAMTLLRKARPTLLAAVWLVVLLKFVLPVGPEFSYSLSSIVGAWLPLPSVTPSPTPCATPVVPLQLAGPAVPGTTDMIFVATVMGEPVCANPAAPTAATKPESPTWWSGVPWLAVVTAVYLMAIGGFAALQVFAYRRFNRRCMQLPTAEPVLRNYVHALCRRVGVRRMPTVRVSEEWPTPFVYGLFSPTLVISVRRYAGPRELEAVLLHEIAHLRRGDLLVRYLQVVVGTLLFFWPVVAWVNRRIDLAREQACDEWALRHGRLSATAYARCLLTAARSRRSGWSTFVPAAMAANASHVERRIDMIMNTSTGLRRGRFLSLLAGSGLVIWGGFVLSGANAAVFKPAVKQDAQTSSTDGASVIVRSKVVVLNSDGEEVQTVETQGVPILSDIPLIGGLFRGSVGGHAQMFVARCDGGDNANQNVNVCINKHQSAESLASFLAAHPTADADANGTLSQGEFDAYHIALAMNAPAGVLGQFPNADKDGDGKLSPDEAARLVTVGLPLDFTMKLDASSDDDAAAGQPMRKRVAIAFAGNDGGSIPPEIQAKIEEMKAQGGGNAGGVRVMNWTSDASQLHTVDPDAVPNCVKVDVNKDDNTLNIKVGDGEPIVVALDKDGNTDQTIEDGDRKVIVRRVVKNDGAANSEEVEVQKIVTRSGQPMTWTHVAGGTDEPTGAVAFKALGCNMVPPTIWLATNVDVTPSAAEVAGFVTLAEQTPLADFLTNNPTADTNADGVLTISERDAFIEKQSVEMRSHLLQAMPEADADGDGTLSAEELHNHLQSKAGGSEIFLGGGPKPHMMMFRGTGASADGLPTDGHMVIRMRTTSTDATTTGDDK